MIQKYGVSYKLSAKNISFPRQVFFKLGETARLNPQYGRNGEHPACLELASKHKTKKF